MAVERPYQQQVGARAQDVAVQSSPDQFGAGLGRAAGELGQAMNRADMQAYQIERQATADSELSEGMRKVVEAKAAFTTEILDYRAKAAPDGKGHPDAVLTAWSQRAQGITEGITDDRVRRQIESQIGSYGGALSEREQVWQAGQAVAYTLSNAEKTQNVMLSEIARDPATYAEHTKLYRDYVSGLSGIDELGKQKMADAYDQAAGVTFLRHSEPVAALAMLATKQFDFLSPQSRDEVQRAAEVEIRRQAAEARTLVTAARQDVNESADYVIKAVKEGQLYDDGELADLEDRATAADLPPVKIAEIQDVRALNTVKREFQNASPAVIAESLRENEAAIAKAGAGADLKLVQRRNHLETVLGQRRTEIGNDQLGFAARNGIESPPIDWTAPAPDAVAARAKAIDIAAAASGMPPQYFTADEVGQFKGRIESGKNGALAALDAARAFGGVKAVAAARQLAPNDRVFAHLVNLNREAAGLALSGRWHLKTDKQAVTLDKNSANFDDYKAEFDRQDASVNQAIQSLGAQQVNTVWSAAREILAGYVAQGFGPLTPEMRMRAINDALGASGPDGARKGGLGRWGDAYFLRPSTMANGEFTRRVQWTVANGKGGGPVNADGSPARLSAAVPVFHTANTYRFEGKDGRPLHKKDGSMFTVWTGK